MSCDSLPWHRRSPKLAAEARLAQDKVPHSICQPCSFQQYSIIFNYIYMYIQYYSIIYNYNIYSIAACNITIIVQLFEAAAWS
eukprot:COSAG06_NODE_295_length_18175_cov_9.088017_10_plen_83_part_00